MKKIISASICLIALSCSMASAAILVYSPNEQYITKPSVISALTSPDTAGKHIVITTPNAPLSTFVNISSGRTIEFKDGGCIALSGSGGIGKLTHAQPDYFCAKGDGVTDDTAAVAASIASNRHTVIPKGKTYAVTGVSKTGLTNFKIDGGGKLFLKSGSNARVLTIISSSHFKVSDIEIDGNGANQNVTSGDRNEGAGMMFLNCSHGTAENNYIHDNFSGAGLLIISKDAATDPVVESYMVGRNNTIIDCGHGGSGTYASDGIYMFSDYSTLDGNIIDNVTDFGIATDYSSQVVIQKNRIRDALVGIGVLGTETTSVLNNNVKSTSLGITVTLGGNSAISPYLSNNVLIQGNVVEDTTVVGLSNDAIFADPSADNITITGNSTINSARGIVAASGGTNIIGNSIQVTSGVGIFMGGANSTLIGNSIKNTTGAPVFWTGEVGQSVDDVRLKTFVDIASFAGSWGNYGTPYFNAGYNISGKTVRLRGGIKDGTTTEGQPIFQLPSNYRPEKTVYFTVNNNGSLATIYIDTNGNVLCGNVANNTLLNLDGVAFDTP